MSRRNGHGSHDKLSQQKPWYLVPGRLDLTEKRLSSKHEKEARRMLKWEETNKYFRDCNAKLKLFKMWEERTPKPLVDLPPFDCNYVSQKCLVEVDEDEISRLYDELQSQLNQIKILNQQHNYFKSQSNVLTSHIEAAENIAIDLKTRIGQLDAKWRKIESTRSLRDRLICQVYIILDKVTSLKESIELLENFVNVTIFSPCECQEFRSILDEAKSLFRTLLNLNHSRQLQISRIYSEEAHRIREQIFNQWASEEAMYFDVFNQIHDALHSSLIVKLRQNAHRQTEILNRRKELLTELEKYVSTLKSDSVVWDYLSNDTRELSIPSDESVNEDDDC